MLTFSDPPTLESVVQKPLVLTALSLLAATVGCSSIESGDLETSGMSPSIEVRAKKDGSATDVFGRPVELRMGSLIRCLIGTVATLGIAFGASSCFGWNPFAWDPDQGDNDADCFLFCPECTRDSDCEFECVDERCTECRTDDDCSTSCDNGYCTECDDDADCFGDQVCDVDSCVRPVCDVHFECEAGSLCLDSICTVLPCEGFADAACIDEGFLCAETGHCDFADQVTGVCALGPLRSSSRAPLLLSASMERQADDDGRCTTGVAWRVVTEATGVRQGRISVFADGANVAQPLVRSSVESDPASFEVLVERGEAIVCVVAEAPFEAQVNVRGDDDDVSNGFCLYSTP